MKFVHFVQIVILLLSFSVRADQPRGGIAFAVMNDCERCMEPYFVPTFQMKVVAGHWPAHGPIYCKGVGGEMQCSNGLRLATERIIFHNGER